MTGQRSSCGVVVEGVNFYVKRLRVIFRRRDVLIQQHGGLTLKKKDFTFSFFRKKYIKFIFSFNFIAGFRFFYTIYLKL